MNSSPNSQNYQLLISTCPDLVTAQHLAHLLLDKHLAACINILPHIQSIYEWQNEVVTETEVILFIKTHSTHYSAIEQLIIQHHPYEIPELIAIPIQTGLPDYLNWLSQATEVK